jgi:hypothetical protein
MEPKKVKGTMLIDLVRMIRGNKELDWNKYLKPEDWNVINERILPSAWYPLEVYQRCGRATFQLLAQGNLELVRLRGRVRGKELFESVYKWITADRTPKEALEQFIRIYGQFFNFSTITFEEVAKGHSKILFDYDVADRTVELYCYQLMGELDALIEIVGGKNARIKLIAKRWEGAPVTIFDVSWK